MSAGAALFTLTAFNAVSQISQGYVNQAEAKANASMIEGQAGLIDIQRDIEQGQYQRMKGRALSTSMASTAAMGVMPSGSAMAVMVDTQKQIEIDQAISRFNYNSERNLKMSEADAYRRKGKQAVYAGYTNAFSSMLSGASNYAMYSGMGKPTNKTTLDIGSGNSPTTMRSGFDLNTAYAKSAGRQ